MQHRPEYGETSEWETVRMTAGARARHVYGAAPEAIAAGAALGLPFVAVVLLLTGHPLAAIVVAVVALTFAALFAAEARVALRRAGAGLEWTASRSRAGAAHAGIAAYAWSSAAVDLAFLGARRRRLERRVKRLLRELGEASYRGDHRGVQVARARVGAAETLIAQTDFMRERARGDARARIARA
jgi:hypothetical protein